MTWLKCMARRRLFSAEILLLSSQPIAAIWRFTRWSQISKLLGPYKYYFSGHLKALSYHFQGAPPLGSGAAEGLIKPSFMVKADLPLERAIIRQGVRF